MTGTVRTKQFVLEQEQPDRIEHARDRRQPADAPHDRVVAADRLEDREGCEPQVDHAPDGEHVARRDDVDLEPVADRAGGLAVDRQGIRRPVDGDRDDERHDRDDLAQAIGPGGVERAIRTWVGRHRGMVLGIPRPGERRAGLVLASVRPILQPRRTCRQATRPTAPASRTKRMPSRAMASIHAVCGTSSWSRRRPTERPWSISPVSRSGSSRGPRARPSRPSLPPGSGWVSTDGSILIVRGSPSMARFVTRLAPIVGARASEVALMNTLTVNIHLLLTSFFRPVGNRRAILTDGPLFPSDRHALVTHLVGTRTRSGSRLDRDRAARPVRRRCEPAISRPRSAIRATGWRSSSSAGSTSRPARRSTSSA